MDEQSGDDLFARETPLIEDATESDEEQVSVHVNVDREESEEFEEELVISKVILLELMNAYNEAKMFPAPFNELSSNTKNGEEIYLEDWEVYKTKFYQTLIKLSESINVLIRVAHDINVGWFLKKDEIFKEIVAEHPDLTHDAVTLIYKQCRCILIILEEYFLLAHYYMPSWRILKAVNRTKKAMEIPFFYELCRLRAITSVFANFKKYFTNLTKPTEDTSGNTVALLNSLGLLPPNVFKWSYPFGIEPRSKSELMIYCYNQTQLEMSFSQLFLNINLVGYHSDIGNYIEELLYRSAWLFISPQPKEFMNNEFSALVDKELFVNLDENFLLGPNSDDIVSEMTKNSASMYICNRNFVYRLILRYYAILSKLAYRSFIFSTKRYLGVDTPNMLFHNLPHWSVWIQEWINYKFDKVYIQMRTEVFEFYSAKQIPPTDVEWCMFRYPLQYISENSVWTIMYGNLKEFMSKTANKDIQKIFKNPSNVEGTIAEYIALRLIKMNFGDKIDFMKYFVISQDDLIKRIDTLKAERKMPILVQSFNRYCLLVREEDSLIMYEFQSIYDTLAAWLLIMIYRFKTEAVTYVVVDIIKQAKREMDKSKRVTQKPSKEIQKTNQYSSFKTQQNHKEEEDEGLESTFF